MPKYYVNKIAQENGDHEVHVEYCEWLPDPKNQYFLGYFNNCYPAVKEGKRHYLQVNGCYHCSRDCHTG